MGTKKNNVAGGCAKIFAVFIIAIILIGLIQIIINPHFLITVIISFVLAAALIKTLSTPSDKKGRFSKKFPLLFFIGILFLFGGLALKISNGFNTSYTENSVEEVVILEPKIINTDTISVYRSNRNWKDNYGNKYSGVLAVKESDYQEMNTIISQYTSSSYSNFWGDLYDFMERKNGDDLDLIYEMFSEIQAKKQLNSMEFAEMVVTCIQDIPYSFVFSEECYPAEQYEESIREVLEDCPDCCIGNIPHGVQAPVGFMANLKGDCDTRTVIIYTILKNYGYDVAILNSDFYRHSILGINLPAHGDYILHNGKKYYVWETTRAFYEIGSLASNFNNLSYWNIILTSK